MNFSDSFRAARRMRFINLILQAILFLTLFAGVNYIALNHSWRFDVTETRKYKLSRETESYLERLDRPITITLTLTTDERSDEDTLQQFRDITALAKEYVYHTQNNPRAKIEVRMLDVYKNGRKAEELGIDTPNMVVVESDKNRRVIPPTDFYRVKNRQRESFQGESVLTAAILDVSNPDKKKIYFLSGHGEIGPDDTSPRGLSRLSGELRARNFDVSSLDLSVSRKIPNEDALLIAVAPQGRFQAYEEEVLRNFLSTRAGRLILLLEPRRHAGLENLLFDWGIIVYDNVIVDPHPQSITGTNDLRIWNFARDLESRITQSMLDNNSLALSASEARVINPDIGRPSDDGLRVASLVATSAQAWGETSYHSRPPYQYTPGQDLRGQLSTMVISERLKPANNLPLSVRGGRLAVLGTGDIVSNNRIELGGNFPLFLATVNWAADRDAQINTPPRPIQRFSLALSQDSLLRLRLGLLLIIPGVVAAIGLIVYWTRRD